MRKRDHKNKFKMKLHQSACIIASDMFRVKEKLNQKHFILPIEEIAGMKVNVSIEIMAFYKRVDVKIESSELYYEDTCNPLYYYSDILFSDATKSGELPTEQDMVKALEELYKILPTLVFDKMEGRIVQHSEKYTNPEAYVKLLSHPNIKLSLDKCCVCLEYTKTTTPCNHTLCYQCWQHIKKETCDDPDCDSTTHRKCPMCRGDIQWVGEEGE